VKGHYALCFKTRASFGAHCENLNEDRSILSATNCSPMTLVSANIRFVPIFEGVQTNIYYILLFNPLSPFH